MKKPLIFVLLFLSLSTIILSIQSIGATSYREGDNGGGVGDPLNYGARYGSSVDALQGSGYAYAQSEQAPGSLGEAWAWFWLADSWTCETSGTYEIVMRWRYSGESTLQNREFFLSASTCSAKGFLYLFVESPGEISQKAQSIKSIFSRSLNDRWKEETFSIDGTTELRYKGYFEEGETYRLRGLLQVIVFSRWVDGITWGRSSISVRGWLERITILQQKYTVKTSATPAGSGYVTGGGAYSSGDTCILMANAYDGYQFNRWGGDLSGQDNPKNFRVNKDTNVIAYFEKAGTTDFSIEALFSDKAEYDPGETVKLYAKIKNTGTEPLPPYSAEASFKVIKPDGKSEFAGVHYNTIVLSEGDTWSAEGSWRGLSNAETGCYDIEVTATAINGLTKSDKTSDAFCLEVCRPPELTLSAPEIDELTVAIDGVANPGCPSASIARIHWDWGDGYEEYSRLPASHTYKKPGSYMISVTLYQNDGLSTKKTFPVTVESSDQLDVQLLAPPTTITSLPITFTAKITSEGRPISNAEVTFYQLSPNSGLIGYAYSGPGGLATYVDFQQPALGTPVTWFAVAQKTGYKDGISLNAALIYQPSTQLEVQILAPPTVVNSTPINFTVRVTCGGEPVPEAIVDFFQDTPNSEPIELGVETDQNGIASHTGFRDGLRPDYHITWHAIAKKWGYQDGRADGEVIHQP